MNEQVNILVVDDEINILRLLEVLIGEMEQFHVLCANSGEEAMAVLERETVHILITDQNMPGVTGIELLSHVTEKYPEIIKILLTAVSDITLAVEAINKGKVFAYLNKPIKEEQFYSVLQKVYDTHLENEKRRQVFAEVQKMVSETAIATYRIVKKIGEGGMADIYKAYDEKDHKAIALKVLKTTMPDPLQVERFKREALACERVNHPGIVRILAKGECNNKLFIAEEFLEGKSLSEVLPLLDRRDHRQSARLALQIIRIIRVIHENGVIHRDLKPNNIFIVNGEGEIEDRIKILDFGIAKLCGEPQITRTGTIEGTAEFVAPESLDGFPDAGPAIDIYAFGIILYYLFFGVSPYRNKTLLEILQHKSQEDLPIPQGSSVPPELVDLVRRTTARRPADRLMDYTHIESVLLRYS